MSIVIDPSLYPYYIAFKYAYPISFIGSILYSFLSIINVNITDIFINKNYSIAISGYLFLCGYISISKWSNLEILLEFIKIPKSTFQIIIN